LGLVGALRKSVDEELAEAFDSVEWQVDPQVTAHTADISPLSAEVIYYAAREAIRNAARYARPSDSKKALHLKIAVLWHNGLEILVEDDGVGMAWRPTVGTEPAKDVPPPAQNGSNGRNPQSAAGDLKSAGGHGLALHSTMMAVVGGSLAVESAPGEYTRVVLSLPTSG
jgi:signal transduction histidine kinase